MTFDEFFAHRIVPGGSCLIWQGAVNDKGYGTHEENMAECSERIRNKGPRVGNGYRKLSEEDIASIKTRYALGDTNKSAIARDFGVTPTRIRQVLK